eukprot:15350911-Ditylum_brightwellii.AAC.1
MSMPMKKISVISCKERKTYTLSSLAAKQMDWDTLDGLQRQSTKYWLKTMAMPQDHSTEWSLYAQKALHSYHYYALSYTLADSTTSR